MVEWALWLQAIADNPTGVCIPIWVVGAITAPLLTAIGVLWRKLIVMNDRTEDRFDRILKRTYELEKDN